MFSSNKIIKLLYRYSILFIGLFIYSVSFNLFMTQYNFVTGGVSGISIIFENLFGINESVTVAFFSIVLLIIGFIICDKDRMYSSVVSSLVLPFFIEITSGISGFVDVSFSPLLAALYCAILTGIALGLVFKVGFSTGGTDIIYWIVQKYIKKSTGQLMIVVEGIIVLAGAFVFGFEKLLYSLIILFLTSKISDKILIGISDSKLIYVIPKKFDEIYDYISSLSFVKSFIIKAEDGKEVICLIMASKDYSSIYSHIKDIDKNAFISANNTYETLGGKV